MSTPAVDPVRARYEADVRDAQEQRDNYQVTTARYHQLLGQARRRRDRALRRLAEQPDRAALAAHARRFARQGRACPPLPEECVVWVRKLKAADPPLGVRDTAGRAPLDHYLARLYGAGWPAGALTVALDVASRDALHRRLRRVRDGRAGECPAWVAELPCPDRPVRPR